METDTKNKKMVLIILVVIFIIASIVFYFFKTGMLGNKQSGKNKEAIDKSQFVLDIKILKDPFVKSLQRYGNFPIKKRHSGRENPFKDYQ